MSNEKQETIADIVAEMRGPYYKMGRSNASLDKDMMGYMSFMANRIEAAAKLEREAGAEAAQICGEIGEMVGREAACHQPVTDCHGLNAAAMREALEKVRFYLPYFLQYMRLRREDEKAGGYYESILEVVSAAISAPPRNCDVGTAEEQAERFMKFCEAHKPDEHQFTEHGELLCPSTGCELIACNYGQCALVWAQMPYEEGCAK